jgi:hypothetical protein
MPSSLKRSANLNFCLFSLFPSSLSAFTSARLPGGEPSSFALVFYFPPIGIRGSLTPFFSFGNPLSLICLLRPTCCGLLTSFNEDCRLVAPPLLASSYAVLLEPTEPLDEIFLDKTLETTLANRFEKVGFSPTCFVVGLSPAKFFVSSSYGSAPVKSLGSYINGVRSLLSIWNHF